MNNNEILLIEACKEGNLEEVRSLLEKGADYHKAVDIVYDSVGDLLLAERYQEAKVLLSAIAQNDFPGYIWKSALAASYPWRFRLENERNELRSRISELEPQEAKPSRRKAISVHS